MPATTKKPSPVRKKAPIAPKRTPVTLDHLLKSTSVNFDKVLALLTDLSKRPAPVISITSGSDAPAASDNASARLDALLSMFTGKTAQQILQDMLDTGRPPTREQLLQAADRMIAGTAR